MFESKNTVKVGASAMGPRPRCQVASLQRRTVVVQLIDNVFHQVMGEFWPGICVFVTSCRNREPRSSGAIGLRVCVLVIRKLGVCTGVTVYNNNLNLSVMYE